MSGLAIFICKGQLKCMVRIISTIVNWHLKGEIQLVSYCQIVILVFPIAGDTILILKWKPFQIHSAVSGYLSLRKDEMLGCSELHTL